MVSLSVAMVSAIWLVSELVLTQAIANVIAAISAVVIVVPVVRRSRSGGAPQDEPIEARAAR